MLMMTLGDAAMKCISVPTCALKWCADGIQYKDRAWMAILP